CFCFQAEDGIRDWSVTGVQTCALPICCPTHRALSAFAGAQTDHIKWSADVAGFGSDAVALTIDASGTIYVPAADALYAFDPSGKIGRASCRERVQRWAGGGCCKRNRER